MPDSPSPWHHLARALEELLLASSEGLALAQQHTKGFGVGAFEHTTRRLAEQTAEWLATSNLPALRALREALRSEVLRWDRRSDGDPDARRVRDLFEALLELIDYDDAAQRDRSDRAHGGSDGSRSRDH